MKLHAEYNFEVFHLIAQNVPRPAQIWKDRIDGEGRTEVFNQMSKLINMDLKELAYPLEFFRESKSFQSLLLEEKKELPCHFTWILATGDEVTRNYVDDGWQDFNTKSFQIVLYPGHHLTFALEILFAKKEVKCHAGYYDDISRIISRSAMM